MTVSACVRSDEDVAAATDPAWHVIALLYDRYHQRSRQVAQNLKAQRRAAMRAGFRKFFIPHGRASLYRGRARGIRRASEDKNVIRFRKMPDVQAAVSNSAGAQT